MESISLNNNEPKKGYMGLSRAQDKCNNCNCVKCAVCASCAAGCIFVLFQVEIFIAPALATAIVIAQGESSQVLYDSTP